MTRTRTSWTRQEMADFVEWHEATIAQYPDKDVVINGHTYNTQRELRRDRIRFVAGVKVS
jgi:hypothetical protein